MGVYTTTRKEKKLIISGPEERVCSSMKIRSNILPNRCRCIKIIRKFDAARDVHGVLREGRESAAAPEGIQRPHMPVCWLMAGGYANRFLMIFEPCYFFTL